MLRSNWRWGTTLRLFGVSLAVPFVLSALLISMALVVVAIGALWVPPLANTLRSCAARICELLQPNASHPLRVPQLVTSPGHGFTERAKSSGALLSDGQTYKLIGWAFAYSIVGLILVAMSFGLIGWGIRAAIGLPLQEALWNDSASEWIGPFHIIGDAMLPTAFGVGIALILIGLVSEPVWRWLNARFTQAFWGIDQEAELAEQVDELTRSRAQVTRDAATELQRIEREVHDGTQAQLAAIGLTIGTAEAVMESDPDRARELLAHARQTTQDALAELRALMRGIRPPVLADRGLGDALRALAIDTSTTITTDISIAGRPDSSVEMVAYFASRELITNAIKYAQSTRIRVAARQERGTLIVSVEDDGVGGARIVPGHGLATIRERIVALGGTLHIDSASTGSIARMEIPCAS